MKKLITLSLFAITLMSCGPSKEEMDLARQQTDESKDVSGYTLNNPNYQVVTVDSCEYILYKKYEGYQQGYSSGLCHKGNCSFCVERNKTN